MSDELGSLRERVTLQSLVRTGDDLGGAALTWSDAETVWAEIAARGGSLEAALDGAAARTAYRVRIRAPSAVSSGWRVVWGGRVLRILAVANGDPGALVLNCEEEKL